MIAVDQLYDQIQCGMVKLVKLAETRLRRLEKCLHLREFEEESDKVCYISMMLTCLCGTK